MFQVIEEAQVALEERGVTSWSCSLPLETFEAQSIEHHSLNTNRRAENLSQTDAVKLLRGIWSHPLDVLLCSYFISDWQLLGAQRIFATDIEQPQRFHRDHHLPAGDVLVLAFTLLQETFLSTQFCLGSHHQHEAKIDAKLLREYPAHSLESSCVLYDSAIVHAGDKQPEALHPHRFFVTFVSTDVSEEDYRKVGRLNGIDTPFRLHRRNFLSML